MLKRKRDSQKAMIGSGMLNSLVYAVLGMPAWLPYPGRSMRERAERSMHAAVLERTRRAAKDPGEDLFTRLLSARDPETDRPMTEGGNWSTISRHFCWRDMKPRPRR